MRKEHGVSELPSYLFRALNKTSLWPAGMRKHPHRSGKGFLVASRDEPLAAGGISMILRIKNFVLRASGAARFDSKRNLIPLILAIAAILFFVFCPELSAQNLQASPDEVAFKLSMEGSNFSKAVNIFLLITLLSLAPSAMMMVTSFTRIVIVLGFLKKAMATQNAPSSRIIGALALFLTIFIMQPVWTEVYEKAIQPYSKGEIAQTVAIDRAVKPFKGFMLKQTRDDSLILFMDLAGIDSVDSPEDLPLTVVIPAYMLSELKTAFQMGFLIYLPFLLVDIVIATTLMSMGMMMLPPMMISLPFKLLLFIVVDGWSLVVRSLVSSFL